MRRKLQQLDNETCLQILRQATSGVLSLIGTDGYPYGVPLSYVLNDNTIYFHCAIAGQKLDAIRNCGKASFCVIERDHVIAEKLTTAYRSVIVRGIIAEEKDPDLQIHALHLLAQKYAPNLAAQAVEQEISGALKRVIILALHIDTITGKQGKELLKQ